jgi:hypothetical protein
MRKLLFIAGLLLVTSGVARAACDMAQPFEVGGSYDYLRVNTSFSVPTETTGSGGGTTKSNTSLNLNGWNAEAVYNLTCWLGAVANFDGDYGTPNVGGFPISTHVYSYVFGPRINFRSMAPFTPFVEALVGGAHASFSNPGIFNVSQNAFEGDFGGGVDINIGSHWAIRPKADYVLTHFNNMVQNNASVSVAFVFKFGGS